MSAAKNSLNSNGPGIVESGLPAGDSEQQGGAESAWSALMDGALLASELDALLARPSSVEEFERWDSYRRVGDALRGESSLVSQVPVSEFLRGFHARLAADSPLSTGMREVEAPLAPPPLTVDIRGKAANDSAFRWKMVAMAASVSAVMAVSWGVLGVGASGGVSATGAVLASGTPAAVPVMEAALAEPSRGTAVVVNTPQGPLIRDARLEALMAEHRQYGGMSALQMPAGFLRNATYDAPER